MRKAFSSRAQAFFEKTTHLRGLLGDGSTAGELVHIGGGIELPGSILYAIPHLTSRRGSTLGTDEVINTSLELAKRGLNVAALGVAGAQKGGIDGEQDPRPALEEDSSKHQTHPEGDLQSRHHRHGRVIVTLDEQLDALGSRVRRVLGLAIGRCAISRRNLGRRDDGGDQGRADVRSNVEDGVDAEWKEGKRVLGVEEPDQGQNWWAERLVSDKTASTEV